VDDQEIDFQESGPFCQHWGDPLDCDTTCDRCGHICAQHDGVADESCSAEECDCDGFLTIDRDHYYVGTVAIRSEVQGMPPKPGVIEAIHGKTLTLRPLWVCENDSRYPGEWALELPLQERDAAHVAWIASGDVKALREATQDEEQAFLKQEATSG
jgi:hypothetical protein